MARLSRSASGLRHLRWGREILATLKAHVEKNAGLSESEREELRTEIPGLSALVDGLSGAVKPYRDFLERTRTGFRGAERVAAYVGDEAMRKEAAIAAESMRGPLKVALGKAITSLREGLDEMDVRLGKHFGERFVESLYPDLAKGNTFIADDDDEDDDATASGEGIIGLGDSGTRPRARELGLAPGRFPPGPLDAITDVADVRVGHVTVIEGERIRTGATAIVPHGGNLFQDKVPAAIAVFNGFGKLVGSTQVMELGELETPILLTNTLAVWDAAAALVEHTLLQPGNEAVESVNPVVGETNDGWLNDIRARVLGRERFLEALRVARTGPVEEGSVGAGTGTRAFHYKGGIGTASRRLPADLGGYTVGALVQANYGGTLTMGGVAVGALLGEPAAQVDRAGSCMIVLATDAPLLARQIERLARRAFAGMARTGASFSHGSGDYAIAFSTAKAVRIRHGGPREMTIAIHDEAALSPLFEASAEATEEAIYNALLRATTVRGRDGHVAEALPVERIKQILAKQP